MKSIKLPTEALQGLMMQLVPPRLVSWQTSFLFGLGILLVSYVVLLTSPENVFDRELLRSLGWFFVSTGVVWRQAIEPMQLWGLPIGAVAAATVVTNFFFENANQEWTRPAFIAWPIITGGLVSLSYFLDNQGHWQFPGQLERLQSLLAGAIGIVIAFWMQCFFITQDWIQEYPNLWNADISRSSFMAAVTDPRQTLGEKLVQSVDAQLYEQFNRQKWSDVEKQLQIYRNNPNAMETQLKVGNNGQSLVELPFGTDWKVSVTSSGTGDPSYLLNTQITWDSPLFFDDSQFQVIRVCEVSKAPLPLELFSEQKQTSYISCNTTPEFIFNRKNDELASPNPSMTNPPVTNPPATNPPSNLPTNLPSNLPTNVPTNVPSATPKN